MATYCVRCGKQVHGLPEHQPHLCKDIAKRLARRERQVDAVMHILDAATLEGGLYIVGDRFLAQDIVTKLANMGVTEDA